MSDDIEGWGWAWRFAIAVVIDIVDLILPTSHIPILATIMDAIYIPIALFLWGPAGLAQATELVMPSVVDGFLPMMTLAGIGRAIQQRWG